MRIEARKGKIRLQAGVASADARMLRKNLIDLQWDIIPLAPSERKHVARSVIDTLTL